MVSKILHEGGVFITGTDTGVGKTTISLSLMDVFINKGLCVTGMKPVASGCEDSGAGLQNEDATRMLGKMNSDIQYRFVNSYALRQPVAPVLAAEHDGLIIEKEYIVGAYKTLSARSDLVVVEGVGGWRIQLSNDLQMSDIVKELDLPVIMVVGLRLGCINHAVLTAEAIANDGCRLLGWIGNQVDSIYEEPDESIDLLARSIYAPMLGSVPYIRRADEQIIAEYLDEVRITA